MEIKTIIEKLESLRNKANREKDFDTGEALGLAIHVITQQGELIDALQESIHVGFSNPVSKGKKKQRGVMGSNSILGL